MHINSTSKPQLLPPEEVSKILGVTLGTLAVWRSTKRYALGYVKIGGKVRYHLSDICNFVESRHQNIGGANV